MLSDKYIESPLRVGKGGCQEGDGMPRTGKGGEVGKLAEEA